MHLEKRVVAIFCSFLRPFCLFHVFNASVRDEGGGMLIFFDMHALVYLDFTLVSFVFIVAFQLHNEFFCGSFVGNGSAGSGGSCEKIEFRKSDKLHETVQGPAQPRAEKALREPIHGRLESLRQRR